MKFFMACAAILALLSCNKDEENTSTAASFQFLVNGLTTHSADSTYFHYDNSTSRHNLYAFKGAYPSQGSHLIQISLTSNIAGTYTLSAPSNSQNWIYYSNGSNIYSFLQGTVAVTSSSNNRVAGSFNASQGTNPAVTSLSGTFTNVQIR